MKLLFIGFTSIESIEFCLGMATHGYITTATPHDRYGTRKVLFLYFSGKLQTINQCDELICNYQSIRQRSSPKLINFNEE